MDKNKITSFAHKALLRQKIQGDMFHSYNFSGSELYANGIAVNGKQKTLSIIVEAIKKNQAKDKRPRRLKLYFSQLQIPSNQCIYFRQQLFKDIFHLQLDGNKSGDAGCQILAKIKWPHLSILNLAHNHISSQGFRQIANSSWYNLKQLDLSYNTIGEKGCEQLSHAKWHLETLALCKIQIIKERCQIGNNGCQYLALICSKHMKRLMVRKKSIIKIGIRLKAKFHQHYAKFPQYLKYQYGQIFRDQDQNKLENSIYKYPPEYNWEQLTQLSFNNTAFGFRVCKCLVRIKMDNLLSIKLGGSQKYKSSKIEYTGTLEKFIHLNLSKLLKQLKILHYVDQNEITEKGCFYLSKHQFYHLQTLTLCKNAFKKMQKYIHDGSQKSNDEAEPHEITLFIKNHQTWNVQSWGQLHKSSTKMSFPDKQIHSS